MAADGAPVGCDVPAAPGRPAGPRQANDDGSPGCAHGVGIDRAGLVEKAFLVAHTGMMITDNTGLIVEVNEALCDFLGYSAAELKQMPFRDYTVAEDVPTSLEAWSTVADGPAARFALEKRYLTKAGEQVWARVTGTAVRGEDGELAHVIVQVEDLTERKAAAASLRRDESHDELTGVVNRRAFYDRLRAALTDPRRSARRVAVLVVNVDRFHQINAGLGQAAADLILREVGRRLREVTRGQDTVARLGGDEFAVLAPGVTTVEDAVALAVHVRRSVGERYWADGNAVFVSARVGVVIAPLHGTDAETLVRKATAATKAAKTHTSGWALHTEGADLAGRDEFGLVRDLRAAITDGQLTVAYQPVVDAQGRVHCMEALARWYHPQRGAVSPDQFIVLAEQNGLIAALTTRVLTSAVHQAAHWRASGIPAPVAVNLSGALLAQPDLVTLVSGVLGSAGLPPESLTLEITETALAEGGNPAIRAALEALRRTGVRISIDDFGTGYCSLAYLKHLPVDELKIDRSFIIDLDSDDRTERIVRSVIHLAHSLNLTVVAEGVEDEPLAEHLLRLGVDYLQGYVIAKPATGQLSTEWLKSRPPAVALDRAGPKENRPLEVLVVDENPEARAALRGRLTERQHRVVEAHSGTAALQELTERMPDVIILDHLLPGLDGVQTAPRLREAGYAGPILLFSGYPPDDLAAIRFPMDVWPVSKADESTFLRLIDGYAGTPVPSARQGRGRSRSAAVAARAR